MVATRDTARDEPRDRRRDFSRRRGKKSVKKRLEFFTETERTRRSETGKGVCLDTALSQTESVQRRGK